MKLIIDISKDRYDEIMSMDWKNCRLLFDEEIRAIHDGKSLEGEPCGDCISRKSVSGCVSTMYYKGLGKQKSLEYILKYVERLPSVSPQPKMGRWEWLSYEGIDEGNWHCSECRMIIPRMPIDDDGKPLYKCCPYCGSKNRGDADVNDK